MIKYLGSKRVLIPTLMSVFSKFPELTSVTDLFSGTSRVGHAAKERGYRVVANDHNLYAFHLAQCYVVADREKYLSDATKLVEEFNRLPGATGFFTQTYCIDSRFFQPKNGERIDAIREEITKKCLDPVLESVVLVSLMEAADRVDSTCGIQMSYLKAWANRSYAELELRVPQMLPASKHGDCEAYQLDAIDVLTKVETDIVYIDPPYNGHSYLSNYHIWETLSAWDFPQIYGVACKRDDCRTRKSLYNSKNKCLAQLTELIENVRAKLLVVSYSDEGFVTRQQIEELLSRRGKVTVLQRDNKRYVGAQIGIHNHHGQRVGTPGKTRNTEYIFVVVPDGSALSTDVETALVDMRDEK